ncbi:hypothetical protein RRG08_038867 [Elysia crispata]|uniref:Uncharacterized protein n=1 Tax=Elysia crispata TaxID=231223 RepID=A0AAE0YSP6_9GAST|nr:hypothetical protein RRG08_038867 [Elysia crispata]
MLTAHYLKWQVVLKSLTSLLMVKCPSCNLKQKLRPVETASIIHISCRLKPAPRGPIYARYVTQAISQSRPELRHTWSTSGGAHKPPFTSVPSRPQCNVHLIVSNVGQAERKQKSWRLFQQTASARLMAFVGFTQPWKRKSEDNEDISNKANNTALTESVLQTAYSVFVVNHAGTGGFSEPASMSESCEVICYILLTMRLSADSAMTTKGDAAEEVLPRTTMEQNAESQRSYAALYLMSLANDALHLNRSPEGLWDGRLFVSKDSQLIVMIMRSGIRIKVWRSQLPNCPFGHWSLGGHYFEVSASIDGASILGSFLLGAIDGGLVILTGISKDDN